jgi:hypothetical protein
MIRYLERVIADQSGVTAIEHAPVASAAVAGAPAASGFLGVPAKPSCGGLVGLPEACRPSGLIRNTGGAGRC